MKHRVSEERLAIVQRLTDAHKQVPAKQRFLVMSRAWHEDGVWNISAYDLPVAVFGDSLEEAQRHFDEAIITHFWGLEELGKVKSTVKHLQELAKDRHYVEKRVLESAARDREVAYPLLMAESDMLCGTPA